MGKIYIPIFGRIKKTLPQVTLYKEGRELQLSKNGLQTFFRIITETKKRTTFSYMWLVESLFFPFLIRTHLPNYQNWNILFLNSFR